jgi:Sec-independent protein translocase protein TatA
MGSDLAIVLIVVLVIVLIWRGPKTLPLLGRAFGQGVKEARKEIEGVKDDSTSTETETAVADETRPPQP